MRRIICALSGLATTLALVGCGQTGELQLPSDPHLDTRPKYLLYHPKQQATNPQDVQAASDVSPSPVQ